MTRVLKVFIASPGDVQQERQAVTEAVHNLSPRTLEMFDVALDVIKWDDFSPVARPDLRGSHQEVINSRVADATIFVGILNRRYGTPDNEDPGKRSGTHMEFETAIRYRDRISILTYYKREAFEDSHKETGNDPLQRKKLGELKAKLRSERIPHHCYDNIEDFRRRIVLDLLEAAFQKTQGAVRRDHARRFFRFGVDWRKHCAPSVLIGYPAIHKHNPNEK
ncbi:MAG: hypothetical protein DRR04_13785 [Gammaproteobacteria bacterium]|nr:MAG: hypothetical protein DRR04_13785 [Gammaproteobacteria bacterium]